MTLIELRRIADALKATKPDDNEVQANAQHHVMVVAISNAIREGQIFDLPRFLAMSGAL